MFSNVSIANFEHVFVCWDLLIVETGIVFTTAKLIILENFSFSFEWVSRSQILIIKCFQY